MDRTERFYKISRMLQRGRAVPKQAILDALEISNATFKRDLEYMRERMGAPIVWDREAGGYRFDPGDPAASEWELPGVWFSEQELRALLTVEYLLESVHPGLPRGRIAPMRNRLLADRTNDVLGHQGGDGAQCLQVGQPAVVEYVVELNARGFCCTLRPPQNHNQP